ncbi:MAG: hypothetical protein MJ252_13580 [archaeon]|nr:hypothetical protein [archaeon]
MDTESNMGHRKFPQEKTNKDNQLILRPTPLLKRKRKNNINFLIPQKVKEKISKGIIEDHYGSEIVVIKTGSELLKKEEKITPVKKPIFLVPKVAPNYQNNEEEIEEEDNEDKEDSEEISKDKDSQDEVIKGEDIEEEQNKEAENKEETSKLTKIEERKEEVKEEIKEEKKEEIKVEEKSPEEKEKEEEDNKEKEAFKKSKRIIRDIRGIESSLNLYGIVRRKRQMENLIRTMAANKKENNNDIEEITNEFLFGRKDISEEINKNKPPDK